jgi:hypothetical protein
MPKSPAARVEHSMTSTTDSWIGRKFVLDESPVTRRLGKQIRFAAAIPLSLFANALLAASASAHVKWFCAYNVAGQPVGIETVVCHDFVMLTSLSILALMTGGVLEGTPVGTTMLAAMDRATGWLRDHIELIARAACAAFFIAVWAIGGILLTPELRTNSNLVGAIQLGIAAGMLSRRSMPLSALGIFVLYGIAIRQYGAFHLADYPVFLGFATYLGLTGAEVRLFGARPVDVLRSSAGITLMWASIEKWAYPEWSYPLFIVHPGMSLGFTPEFYMRAAGVVEFTLAFSLVWTPLVRRVGAIILTAMFVSACFPFGKIDMIGHSLIVVALLAIVADDAAAPAHWRRSWLIPFAYTSSLILFVGVYYFAHMALYGTTIL